MLICSYFNLLLTYHTETGNIPHGKPRFWSLVLTLSELSLYGVDARNFFNIGVSTGSEQKCGVGSRTNQKNAGPVWPIFQENSLFSLTKKDTRHEV